MVKVQHNRVIVLMMDSFGLGFSDDAHHFGDQGANTLGHIAAACARGHCDGEQRRGPLHLPNLVRLGLAHAAHASCGEFPAGLTHNQPVTGAWGYAVERSKGKDTPSGHWEIAGVPVTEDWGYFPDRSPSFPARLTQALITQAGLPGLLGNRHASGTDILEALGEQHLAEGKPIVYTSTDSVFQIAAHEHSFGLQKLYDLCELARRLVDEYKIGRVIARPFLGLKRGEFKRTGNRRDYATPPPRPTLLDELNGAGREVIAIGKIGDIYAHQGVTHTVKANGNTALFDATLAATRTAPQGALVFTNFVDFDMLYGHRRDVSGYATALEVFDRRLPELESLLRAGDLLVITADHGCDPTWPGTEHTREHIPALLSGPRVSAGGIGRRETFADIGQTIAAHLGIDPLEIGEAALPAGGERELKQAPP